MEMSVRTVCGIEVQILKVGTTTVTCISDPVPMPWVCDALLSGMTPARLLEAERRLPRGLVDASAGTITIGFNTFLIQTGRNTILVDAGIGNDKHRPERPVWSHRSERYLEALAALGGTPDAIDTVISTHLHADHTGWNTRLENGRWVPTFRNARYICARDDLDYWSARYAADRAEGRRTLFGSFEDSVVPVLEADLMQAVSSDAEPLEGLRFRAAAGHSPGMVAVEIETGAEPVHLWSDIAHHAVQFLWNDVVSVACTDPEQARQTRLDAIARARATRAVVAGTHLVAPVFGRLTDTGGKVAIRGL